jgi:AraC-like DNA-binding protein
MCIRVVELEPTTDTEHFLRNPLGKVLRRPAFDYWYPRPGVTGYALVGRPGRAGITELDRVIDFVIAREEAHVSLIDARYLDAVDQEMFDAMISSATTRMDGYRRLIERQAVIRPPGVIGAFVMGFHQVLSPLYRACVFESPNLAVEWLGMDDPASVVAALDALTRNRAHMLDPVVLRLRAYLREYVQCATIGHAAIHLATSPRTLQRRLEHASTSFSAELNQLRVAMAQEAMLSSEKRLARIASDLGCASPQHFSSVFRRLTGESPTAWRRRHTRTHFESTSPHAPGATAAEHAAPALWG